MRLTRQLRPLIPLMIHLYHVATSYHGDNLGRLPFVQLSTSFSPYFGAVSEPTPTCQLRRMFIHVSVHRNIPDDHHTCENCRQMLTTLSDLRCGSNNGQCVHCLGLGMVEPLLTMIRRHWTNHTKLCSARGSGRRWCITLRRVRGI